LVGLPEAGIDLEEQKKQVMMSMLTSVLVLLVFGGRSDRAM
jgi:hypothetical protein